MSVLRAYRDRARSMLYLTENDCMIFRDTFVKYPNHIKIMLKKK